MRIFVALDISNKKVLESIQDIQKKFANNGKAVELNNMHFTLQFLGEVGEKEIENIVTALKGITFSSFDLRLKGIGVFPKPKAPRIIWVGTEQSDGNVLSMLAKKVEDCLFPLGYKPDKKFRPHLTILRIKDKVVDISTELEKNKDVEIGTVMVSAIKLKRSKLTSQGPIYSDLEVINSS